MAFKPANIPASTDPTPSEWRLDQLNGGVVYTDLPQRINDNQSPGISNLWYKEKALTKRYGQEYLFDSLGTFPILSVYNKLYKGKVIFSASTKLYSLDLTTKVATEIHTGLTAEKGSFFVFKNAAGADILYYKNKNSYVKYDGTTVSNVVGYIPLVITGRAPTGGGTVYEDYNRLQAGFKNSFSGTGSATAYTLTQTGLDATLVTATVGGVAKAETTDFTVDRATGIVTFISAPASGTDNVVITAYKTDAAGKAVFMDLKYSATFGGDNDSRVFFAGDSTTYYYCGLSDPTFIPENNYNNAGVDNTYITGFGKQYDFMIVFKEQSTWMVTYEFDGSTVSFPLRQVSDAIGCDMSYTIQLINGYLVWCTTYGGVYTLYSTLLKEEKDIKPLSANINGTIRNPGLLNETKANLQAASSVDFFGHYWLCVGTKVWAWNYEITPYANTGYIEADQQRLAWFPFTNINANVFLGVDKELYYGDRTVGRFVHFINNYKDFGLAINVYWKSKLLDFGLFDWTKVILQQRFSTKSDTYTEITTKYAWDDGDREDSKKDITTSLFWYNLRWDLFTWRITKIAQIITKRPNIVNTVYYQTEISNNVAGQNLSVLDMAIMWMQYRKVG